MTNDQPETPVRAGTSAQPDTSHEQFAGAPDTGKPRNSTEEQRRAEPFEDMPGSGRNEGRLAGLFAMWGFILLAVGVAVWALTFTGGISESDDAGRVLLLLIALSITSFAMFAVASYCLGQHYANTYALQVAVVRSSGSLEGTAAADMPMKHRYVDNVAENQVQAQD